MTYEANDVFIASPSTPLARLPSTRSIMRAMRSGPATARLRSLVVLTSF